MENLTPIGRIQGTNLYIRDHTDLDFLTEELYLDDKELNVLDPVVGVCNNPTMFSVFTNSDTHIGVCGMYNYMGGQIEFGIRIWDRSYWGRGYGSEITGLLCDWAFEHTNVDVIVLKTPTTNLRAIRCYTKCGFDPYAVVEISGIKLIWMQKKRE